VQVFGFSDQATPRLRDLRWKASLKIVIHS